MHTQCRYTITPIKFPQHKRKHQRKSKMYSSHIPPSIIPHHSEELGLLFSQDIPLIVQVLHDLVDGLRNTEISSLDSDLWVLGLLIGVIDSGHSFDDSLACF